VARNDSHGVRTMHYDTADLFMDFRVSGTIS
jgi:hypothetical protein